MKILLLNPNSSSHMTQLAVAGIESLAAANNVQLSVYTAPETSPASIDDSQTIAASTSAVYADLQLSELSHPYLSPFDAIIVACFSQHPLVSHLYWRLGRRVVVTGIFEASCLSAVSFLQHRMTECAAVPQLDALAATQTQYSWGIVTTGQFWEDHLREGVEALIGKSDAFAGVFSTGLNASDFHDMTPEAVREKLVAATKRLLDTEKTTGRRVNAVVMGCAGMSGLDTIIKHTVKDYYGDRVEGFVVIDGVKAGLLQAVRMVQEKGEFTIGGQLK